MIIVTMVTLVFRLTDDSAEELARDQRIAILQSRISEIRKIYMELKSEVALIDRRRKRARRKEREAEREGNYSFYISGSIIMPPTLKDFTTSK